MHHNDHSWFSNFGYFSIAIVETTDGEGVAVQMQFNSVEISMSNPLEIFLHYLVYFTYLVNY